jgi:hypothetical protein
LPMLAITNGLLRSSCVPVSRGLCGVVWQPSRDETLTSAWTAPRKRPSWKLPRQSARATSRSLGVLAKSLELRELHAQLEPTSVFEGLRRGAQILDRHTHGLEQRDFAGIAPAGRPAQQDLTQLRADVRLFSQALT